jgi:cytoskeletal protein CcmA (bactofilin family)
LQVAWDWLGQSKDDGDSWTGFLEQGVRVEGTLELPGTFRINALAKGRLVSDRTLMLGEQAMVEGEIDGNIVIITGRFQGVIRARNRVEIQARAIVGGEIHTPCLILEPGGVFQGKCGVVSESPESAPIMVPIRSGPISQS